MKPLLLVDGYNVIGAWSVPREEHLSIEQARERLVHLIADYAGYSGEEVIVVFDGHYTDRPTRSRTMMHGVEVVFTKHAESADNYIEAACDAAPKWRRVRVATSDAVEQTVTLGRGSGTQDVVVTRERYPSYQGAVVVCEGAGDAAKPFTAKLAAWQTDEKAQDKPNALVLTAQAQPIVAEGRELQRAFADRLAEGLSAEDLAHFRRCVAIFDRNIEQIRAEKSKRTEIQNP